MPVRPPAGKRQCRLLPAGNRDLRAGRNVLDEFRDHIETRPIVDEVQIVEHEHQGTLECRQSSPDTRDAFRPGGCPSAGQRVEHLRRDRLDSVDRGCDVAQEHNGVAVSRVEHDPRKRARVSLGPTCEKGCLAVPDRRNHTRERHARGAEARDHVLLGDGAGPNRRRCELDLREVERNVRSHRNEIKQGSI